MDKFENQKSFGESPRRSKYNRLTAQIIKNSIKKRIFDVKRRKNGAIEELLSQLEEKMLKSNGEMGDLILKIISLNRKALEKFVLDLAFNSDTESLACFFTNLVYGGFLTETLNNSPVSRYIELENSLSPDGYNELYGVLKNDTREGRRVCIIRGDGLLNENMIKLYRYFGETAFILIDKNQLTRSYQGIYNVLFVPETAKNSQNRGIERKHGQHAIAEHRTV